MSCDWSADLNVMWKEQETRTALTRRQNKPVFFSLLLDTSSSLAGPGSERLIHSLSLSPSSTTDSGREPSLWTNPNSPSSTRTAGNLFQPCLHVFLCTSWNTSAPSAGPLALLWPHRPLGLNRGPWDWVTSALTTRLPGLWQARSGHTERF